MWLAEIVEDDQLVGDPDTASVKKVMVVRTKAQNVVKLIGAPFSEWVDMCSDCDEAAVAGL